MNDGFYIQNPLKKIGKIEGLHVGFIIFEINSVNIGVIMIQNLVKPELHFGGKRGIVLKKEFPFSIEIKFKCD
jgi:hypothetical protein